MKIAAEPGRASNTGNKSHNPELRALLSIKNFSATLLQDYAQLFLIEKELDELHKKWFAIIEEHAAPLARICSPAKCVGGPVLTNRCKMYFLAPAGDMKHCKTAFAYLLKFIK